MEVQASLVEFCKEKAGYKLPEEFESITQEDNMETGTT